MKNILYFLIVGLIVISCGQDDPEISPEMSDIQLSLGDIYFGESGSRGSRVNAITWSHVLGGTGSITFDNQDNDYSATFAVDGSNLGAGSYSLPNGTYDISLDLDSTTPADYLPYTASLTGQVISGNQTLTFDATTTFGLVLLGLDSVDQTVTPTFNLSSTDYDLTLDAVQEFYYLYVPGAASGTLTATETFYDQSLSVAVSVTASTIHAYAFKLVTSDAGISVNFADFSVVENDWDIDGYQRTFGSALHFNGDGNDDITITVTTIDDHEGTSNFTWETWYRPDNIALGGQPIVTNSSLSWNIQSGGIFNMQGLQGQSTVPIGGSGVWTHMAVTYDGAFARFYVNGQPAGVVASASGNIPANTLFGMGANVGNHSAGIRGALDETRFWSTTRTDAEILANYQKSLTGSEPGLLAYYKFDEGVPSGDNTGINTIIDSTGNGNTGTLNSFTKTGSTSNWVASFEL
jgi:hypothetical protein